MGASDFVKGMSRDELDSSRLDRENRTNQPEFSPGQGGDDLFGGSSGDDLFGGSGDDLFGSSSGGNFGGLEGGDLFGGGSFGGQPQAQPQQKSGEDMFYDAVATGGKGIWSFSKEVSKSFKGLTPKFWSVWGTHTTFAGVGGVVVGLICCIFGLACGISLIVGSIIACATGVLVLMLNTDKARLCTSQYVDGDAPAPASNNSSNTLDSGSSDDFDFGDGDSDDEYCDFFGDDSDEYDSEESDDTDMFDMSQLDTPVETSNSSSKEVSTDDALNSLQEIPKGTYTRQYLYDAFTKVLPSYKADYGKVKKIDKNSDTFIGLEHYIREAGSVLGMKEEDLPELLSAEENLFRIKMCITRSKSLKPDDIAKELASIYAYNVGVNINSNKVYAKAEVVGTKCYISLFTGENALISLKDMYDNCKDFLLDSNHLMPAVLGIDQEGNPITADFKELESIIVAGMPRSGKSWLVQGLITQLSAFCSPTELNFYICDPKEGISDFKAFCLPHVKQFASDDNSIVNLLRRVVSEIAPRRKKIIGDAGFVNIWDYKKKYPDVHMPVIYVLIDEAVTLAERMDKDTKKEFQGYLVQLISQLPALGIRAFLIPHVVKNDIIAKTATDLVQCRISVCGDAGHIEACTGAKPKDFKYKLANKGDLAVNIPALFNGEVRYVHAPALTDDNVKNNEVFDYLRRVWSKLEPEESKDSYAVMGERISENKMLEEKSNQVEFENSNSQGLSGFKVEPEPKVMQSSEPVEEEFEDFNSEFEDDFFNL